MSAGPAAGISRARSSTPGGPVTTPFTPPKRKTGGSVKGKERALESHGPHAGTITYRHLLGNNNGGAANPLRCIAHVDIDAAYAAMEMARLGIDPSTPLAVQQWNGLIAVNYPARKFGITRHEPPAEALKKCPDLVMVHVATYRNGDSEPGYWDGAKPETHKVSLDPYRRESLKILRVFSEFCPVVEKASIDESYLDVTLPVRAQLLERYPALANLPEGCDLDSPLPSPKDLGVSIEWERIGNLIPVTGQKKDSLVSPAKPSEPQDNASPEHEIAGGDQLLKEDSESTPPIEEPPLSWSDVALAIGAEIVLTCRMTVHERLGYTCSAGIAPNKMLAKLCSAWKKPNAQTILRSAAIPAFLHPLPFQKIRMLGGKLGVQVSDAYGVVTVGDLLNVTLPELQAKLGDDSGTWLWEIIRGLDYSEVETKTQTKSMLSSKNFRPTITRYADICHWIKILATELHLRLSEARDLTPGLWPKTITFTHRSANYVIRSHQIAFPFTSRLDIAYINKFGEKLLRIANGDKQQSLGPETKIGPYSNIQLSFSGMEKLEDGQKGIERFFSGQPAAEGKRAGPSTIDRPIKRPRIWDKPTTREVDALVIDEDDGEENDIEVVEVDNNPTLPTATCDVCSKALDIPPNVARALAPNFASNAVAEALRKVREEHADWHVARALLEEDRQRSWSGLSSGPTNKACSLNKDKKPSVKNKAVTEAPSSPRAKMKPGQQSLKTFFA